MKIFYLFIFLNLHQTKHVKKSKESRQLKPGPMGPPKTVGQTFIGPNNAPQITAPRVLVKNLPKPNDRAYSYP